MLVLLVPMLVKQTPENRDFLPRGQILIWAAIQSSFGPAAYNQLLTHTIFCGPIHYFPAKYTSFGRIQYFVAPYNHQPLARSGILLPIEIHSAINTEKNIATVL